MKKIITVMLAVGLLVISAGTSAASLQPTAGLGGPSTGVGLPSAASVNLQPAGAITQGSTSDGLSSSDVGSSLQVTSSSGFSKQEIKNEADLSQPQPSSASWLLIVIIVCAAVAIVLAGTLAFRGRRAAEADN